VLEIFLMRGNGSGTFAGMSRARSGMWRSPMTRTRRDVILTVGEWSGFAEGYGVFMSTRSSKSVRLASAQLLAIQCSACRAPGAKS
jgi:hypothetical protein